jgi:hypothetical protein
MKSGGQMSSQSPVVWWYREVLRMCVEAGSVLGADGAKHGRIRNAITCRPSS